MTERVTVTNGYGIYTEISVKLLGEYEQRGWELVTEQKTDKTAKKGKTEKAAD